MLLNYFKIALRNLLRHKLFSLINILGLAIGMAACLLILQYVHFELSYDTFHRNGKDIYRVPVEYYLANGQRDYIEAAAPPAMGPTLKQDFPEVADMARIFADNVIMTYQNTRFWEEKIYYADPSFLSVFSFPLINGDARTALSEPNTLVLTESAARKYFGKDEPVGKIIQLDGQQNLLVTGVLQDVPVNSHLQFSALISFATLEQREQGNLYSHGNDWGWYNFFTYLRLKPQVNADRFAAKLPAFIQKYQGEDMRAKNYGLRLFLQPLSDIQLNNTVSYEKDVRGNRQAVYFLAVIALFIVVIAWVNYVNLSTARAAERAKEVGIRKVVGSTRLQLIQQFLLESVLINLIAVTVAVFLAYALLPFFGSLVGKNIPFTFWQDERFTLLSLGLLLTGTVASAFYPAFVLSSFKPVRVLKGNTLVGNQGIWLRRSLVVVQFAASVALIIGTLVVYRQLQFMRRQELGVNIDQTLIIRGPQIQDSTYATGKFTFQTELLRHPGVRSVTFSNQVPGEEVTNTAGNVHRKGEKGKEGNYSLVWIDYNFIPAYQLKMVAGRNFSAQFGTDRQAVVLNETAVRALGFRTAQAALNQVVIVRNQEKTVVGVVKDYHQRSLQNRHEPMVFIGDLSRAEYFSIKINSANSREVIAAVKSNYEVRFPGNPFEYFFLDEYFAQQYQADQQFGQAFAFFAGLAIFVACLGLFGLASFTTAQRTKEIGVRKVLGASVADILLLLSKDFIRLLVIAFLVAVPVAWYVMHQWLQNYAFRTDLTWWLFALPALLVLFIALLTVSFQAIKAAVANPVKALRSE